MRALRLLVPMLVGLSPLSAAAQPDEPPPPPSSSPASSPHPSTSLVAPAPTSGTAPRAAHARPDELDEEGVRHMIQASLVGSYARARDAGGLGGVASVGTIGLRTRLHLAKPVSYCVGLDADVGASDEGVAYAATAYLAGVGVRFGAASVVALCGGVGVDGAGDAIPVAARFPAELSAGFEVGPTRPALWLRPAWVAGAVERRDGAGLDVVDEVELGASIRIGRQHRYWSDMSAGGGPVFGVTYRRLLGADLIGGFVGIELGAAQ